MKQRRGYVITGAGQPIVRWLHACTDDIGNQIYVHEGKRERAMKTNVHFLNVTYYKVVFLLVEAAATSINICCIDTSIRFDTARSGKESVVNERKWPHGKNCFDRSLNCANISRDQESVCVHA